MTYAFAPAAPEDSAHFDVIVVGAGAAGMMCAATAGQRGRRVLLIDHATRLAEKIRISGGGRCNFTNRFIGPDRYVSANPHFCIIARQFGMHVLPTRPGLVPLLSAAS